MKLSKLFLAGIALGSTLGNAENLPLPLSTASKAGSHLGHQQRTLQPPRTMSPYQFMQMQRHQHNSLSSDVRSTLNTNQSTLSVNSLNQKTFSESSFGSLSANAADVCSDPSELLPLAGEQLVAAVKSANITSCLYGLYNAEFAGTDYFSDAKLMTIVSAINDILVGYDGTSAAGASELEKLVTYLRATHWAESSAGTERDYSTEYQTALSQAFDSYFNAPHFVSFNGDVSRDFMVRYEMLVLVNSSKTDNQPYLKRFTQAIIGYANSVDKADGWGVAYEENGMTQLLTHLFNAVTTNPEATSSLLESEPEIVDNLVKFVTSEGVWLIGKQREYQWSDAVSELGRLLQFKGAIADKVRPVMQKILTDYQFRGVGSNGWVNAQSMVLSFDSENCSLYGDACSFDLESAVLSGNHVCSDTIKLRFEEPIVDENLQSICKSLTAEEAYFHQRFDTPQSVKNDNNKDLEVVIFSSSTEYQNYAGKFFGINTDNGGMYLEGVPSDQNNQARFVAFQATWLPDFTVWNLEHEYVHYLDGRFNKWGGFNDQPANSVWWGEGVAEYMSSQDDNDNAMSVAPDKTYSFSDLLQTTYDNGDTERVYYWGYLAVRFMFERHLDQVKDRLLPSMRAAKYPISDEPCLFDWQWRSKQEATDNNWSWLYDDSANASGNWVWTCGQTNTDQDPLPEYEPYQDIIDDWTGKYDVEFSEWLDCYVEGRDCSGNSDTQLQNGVPVSISGLKGSEQHFSLNLPENAYDLRIETQGGIGDLDLYVRQQGAASLTDWDYRPYWIGNREHVEIMQPSNEIDVMIHGYRDFSDATLTATWKEGNLSEIKQWSSLSSSSKIYQWVYVPVTAKALYFTLSGGKGDAQLYVKQDGWPANNDYDGASSITRGTTQKIKMENIKPGNYYHILVDTLEGFDDVKLSVMMVE
ncbi:M9 family metallopeptidase [Aliikangiella sp. G2MR2-5]|uniref:M9 family metallopeptidase n=1 Tax=Aliikangiella sp. G2MR2-5 TaxID=2788943 RepID=UPI0018AAFA63|nr:M9 family metallopeptidase [Aliikangiella sp. G2MR2-5]